MKPSRIVAGVDPLCWQTEPGARIRLNSSVMESITIFVPSTKAGMRSFFELLAAGRTLEEVVDFSMLILKCWRCQ